MTMESREAGRQARGLVRASPVAALATALRGEGDEAGWPYASLVTVASAHDGTPLMLLSELAEHSANIARDARASLLFRADLVSSQAGEALEDPLAGPRVTVVGRAVKSEDAVHRARFLARHPAARVYADFKDFHIYRLGVERAHLVAGFGVVRWMDGDDFLYAGEARELAASEEAIVAHMNADHTEALALYAERLLNLAPQAGAPWRMTGIDPEGCDLRRSAETARLAFATEVRTAAEARAELVRLAALAREAP